MGSRPRKHDIATCRCSRRGSNNRAGETVTVDWNALLNTIGLTAAGGGALAWLAKSVFTHALSHDLEAYKASLKRDADAALLAQKAEFDQQLAGFQSSLVDRKVREERVRLELERWANPILDAVTSLSRRLENILDHEGHIVLAPSSQWNPEWSVTPGYFLPTTVFLFAQYFCWERLLQESVRFDLFPDQADKDTFLNALRGVGKPLGSFPLAKLDGLPSGDSQVFSLQQRRAGEALIVEKESGPVCMRAADFLVRWNDAAFAEQFEPLTSFLQHLTPATRRWKRLELVRDALKRTEMQCRCILQRP